jgi:hypothetical protein
LSRTLTLIFNGINVSCKIDFELDAYRFWGILVNQEVILTATNVNSNGVFYINWGDGTNERFDYKMLDNKEFRYKYENKGNYNGKITYKISDNDQNCQRDRYFAVLVDGEDSNNNLYYMFLLALLIAGLLILHYLVIKEKQKTVQSN